MTEAPHNLFPRTVSLSSLRARLSWLWGGNPFYLASAACILAGLYQILYPVYQQDNPHLEKFFSLIALNGYELTLLGVTLLILAWRNVVDDAVALTVIISLFLVGATMGLDAIAPGFTLPTLMLGLVAALLAVVKLYSLNRFIIGRFTPLQLAGLALLMACNLFVPAALSHCIGHDGIDPLLIRWWLAGWWLTLIALSLLVFSALVMQHGQALARDACQPFLRTSVMRWIVIAIVATGTLVHQWGLFWSFGLPLHVGDLFPGLILMSLLAIAVLRSYSRGRPLLNLTIAAVPLVAYAVTVVNGNYSFSFTTSPVWGLISYPPIPLFLAGLTLLALAWPRRRWHLHSAALIYLSTATLSLGVEPTSQSGFSLNLLPMINTLYHFVEPHGPGWPLVALSFLILACGTVASLCKRPANSHITPTGPGNSPSAPIAPAP